MPTHRRTAIIGAGNIAGAHAKAYRSAGDRVELVAAVDVDPERLDAFCDEHGIDGRHTDPAAMLADAEPDLVSVCTPPGLHAGLSIHAMRAGAWVWCEKPLCASLAELDNVQAVERETGRHTACVFQWRFGSAGRHVRGLITSGALGRPLVGQCVTTWYRGHDYYDRDWRGTFASELGGPTMGHGIHAMDCFLFLAGPWRRVKATAATLDRDIEVEDVSAAIVEFESGMVATVLTSILCPRQASSLRLDLQHATVESEHLYHHDAESWNVTATPDTDRATANAWAAFPQPDVPVSHAAQLAALLDDMDAGRTPETAGDSARQTLELLTAIYKAALTGETVGAGSIHKGDPFYEQIHGGMAVPHHVDAAAGAAT